MQFTFAEMERCPGIDDGENVSRLDTKSCKLTSTVPGGREGMQACDQLEC